ncbi:MAG: hypothetical protein E6G66_17570, partial [Actinobacteria bacterium]
MQVHSPGPDRYGVQVTVDLHELDEAGIPENRSQRGNVDHRPPVLLCPRSLAGPLADGPLQPCLASEQPRRLVAFEGRLLELGDHEPEIGQVVPQRGIDPLRSSRRREQQGGGPPALRPGQHPARVAGLERQPEAEPGQLGAVRRGVNPELGGAERGPVRVEDAEARPQRRVSAAV